MPKNLNLRELEEKDVDQAKFLVSEIYAENPKTTNFTYRPSYKELSDLFKTKLSMLNEKSLIDMVAELKGEIVGECEIVLKQEGKEKYGIVGIIVKREHRRKGIGSSLLKKATEKAKELKISTLVAEVDKSNKPAIQFFKKEGFKEKKNGEKIVFEQRLDLS